MTCDVSSASTPEDCLRRYRDRGDSEALATLFDLTAPHLFRVAVALAPDAATAEDALQETYLSLLTLARRYDASRPVVPWLVGILRLKVHEARRRVHRSPDPARVHRPGGEEEASIPIETREESARVRAALAALPEPYRNVAILRWEYGLAPAEIAHARGEPPGTVRSLLARALERLRTSLHVLPAAFGWPRAPRGLDSVRESIATAVRFQGVATTVAAAGGGALMAGKAWAVAGVAALTIGGGSLVWTGARPRLETARATGPDAELSPRPAASPEVATLGVAPVRNAEGQRMAALEAEIHELRARLAPFETMDPADVLLHGSFDISKRLRAIAALPGDGSSRAAWALGRAWSERPEHAEELVRALTDESDPGALRVLAEVLRAGGIANPPPDAVRRSLDVLHDGSPADRRVAAMHLLQSAIGGRDRTAGVADGILPALVAAIRTEAAPEVIAAAVSAGDPPAELLSAVETRLSLVTAREPRRKILHAIARRDLWIEEGEALWVRWVRATTPDERDDIAYAIGLAANQMSRVIGDPEKLAAHRLRWRDRVLEMYGAANDAATRRFLARGATFGFDLGIAGPEGAAWVRALAAAEPDPARKQILERCAAAVERGEAYQVDFPR